MNCWTMALESWGPAVEFGYRRCHPLPPFFLTSDKGLQQQRLPALVHDVVPPLIGTLQV